MQNTWINFSCFNDRSLYASIDLFSDFVLEGTYDVVGLSQTWLSSSISNSCISITGNNLVRDDREDRVGGGVAFYVKDTLKFYIGEHVKQATALEHLWMSLKLAKDKRYVLELYTGLQI